MRCMNCGLPLSPERNMASCPRCGAALNALQGVQQQQQQFEQAGWGNMGGASQPSPWGQVASPGPYNSFTQAGLQNQSGPNAPTVAGFNNNPGSGLHQSPLSPRRPYAPPPKNKSNPRLLFMAAGLCVLLAAMLLGLIYMLASSGSGSPPSQNTASTNSGTTTHSTPATQAGASPTAADATPTVDSSPTATGTAYPGQQYIDGAQMATGVDKTTLQPQTPTTTFKVGSSMYVVFNLHPPGQGGFVCSYWYLNGNQVISYPLPVKGSSHISYTYATYGSAGSAYVELYWASNKSCSDKILAQHVDFTVSA